MEAICSSWTLIWLPFLASHGAAPNTGRFSKTKNRNPVDRNGLVDNVLAFLVTEEEKHNKEATINCEFLLTAP